MIILGVWAMPAMSAETSPAKYPERLTFDPQTGEWVQIASPVPGTEDGDLELARSMLARGKAKKASKQLKKWLEMYPDSPRYPEGLFYLADADFRFRPGFGGAGIGVNADGLDVGVLTEGYFPARGALAAGRPGGGAV